MTVTPELVFDRERTGERVGSARPSRGVVLGTGAVLVAFIVIAVQLVSAPSTREGAQVTPDRPILLERPAVDGWDPLVPVAGELPAGFGPPLVRSDDRMCIGFARVDFGPDDLRPSLARCERHRPEPMAANEIRLLVAVKSGFDTWHFFEAPDDIDSITLRLATGEQVSDDRILLSGSTVGFRLQNDRDLASLRWSTRSHTYRCTPDPTAWRTSEFCADRTGDADD